MSKQSRDWKIILSTNNYHSIFIKSNGNDESLLLLYKYWEEIAKIEDYLLLLPTYQEKEAKDYSGYISKFAPPLKSFLEDKTKKTLIAEEGVMNALLKQDKRENFFKFLAKQKKNVIVFCETDYERYVQDLPQPYNFLIMEHDAWKNSIDMFERFSDIKVAISQTYNPFKDPSYAFKKYSNGDN